MTDALKRVTDALESQGRRLLKSGSGFITQCPAHDDRTPSLHVSRGRDGRAVVHCFAGCAPERIVATLGLSMRDLFNGVEQHRKSREGSFLFEWRSAVLSVNGPPSPITRLVLITLSMHANQDGASCFPSQRLLMAETALTSRTIVDHLRAAVLHGWIQRFKRTGAGRGSRGYTYLLDIPPTPRNETQSHGEAPTASAAEML